LVGAVDGRIAGRNMLLRLVAEREGAAAPDHISSANVMAQTSQ
jgi:hypothetical protein